ncbi:MAG TPA: hypothetical protein DDW49_01430 [Deltaproteobacteria bacterium]|nr:hypothetical protein [Deltaproteobacteria bacterium]
MNCNRDFLSLFWPTTSMQNHYYVYTDASFNQKHNLGVSGFYIFHNSREHNAGLTPLSVIRTVQFQETSNIRAELRGALSALEAVETQGKAKMSAAQPDWAITLYTDCQTISYLLKRREKLESCKYVSHRKKNRSSQCRSL